MTDIKCVVDNAQAALEEGFPDKALAILNSSSIGDCKDVLFLKGEIYFKMEKWGDALNHFSAFHDHFPADTRAESYIKMIQNILGFFHRDLYNP